MQCQAMTLASTYSTAHRCLKTNGVKKTGSKVLCAHHRTAGLRAKPASLS